MYGFLIGITTLISSLLAEKLVEVKKLSITKDDYWHALLITIISAVVGGRLYHVLDFWQYYSQNPQKIIAVWEGGMGIFGAIILSFVSLYFLCKRKKQNLFVYTDLFLLFAPLVQIAGRFGNYFNNELFGKPTDLPIGVNIPVEARPEGFKEFSKFHPLFFYEIVFNGILFSYFVDMVLRKSKRSFLARLFKREDFIGSGTITSLYLIFYGLTRLILEPFRLPTDSFLIFGMRISYLISIMLIFAGILIFRKR